MTVGPMICEAPESITTRVHVHFIHSHAAHAEHVYASDQAISWCQQEGAHTLTHVHIHEARLS